MEDTIVKGFSISTLDRTYERKSFCCGVASLDDYFHKRVGQESRKRIAVTYVLYDEAASKVAGYYTLSATAIELIALPEARRKKLPTYPCLPATLIGRLAIDEAYKKRGLGEIILIDALKRAHYASLTIASYAVVVDAVNERAEKFYRKYGFSDLSNNQNRLFLPMSLIENMS